MRKKDSKLYRNVKSNRESILFSTDFIKTLIKASFFAGLLLVLDSVYAQTFDNIKDQKPFKISGGIGGGTEFFTSNEPVQSRDPFAWNVYGHLNPSVYGFSFPFSFTISQYSKSFTQPFTQMGISPSYKWAKLHLGYRSMEFSPFVFDGSTFWVQV